MRKRTLVITVTLSVASGVVILWMLLPKPEPSYQGRRLSEWLETLDDPPGSARFRAPGWYSNWKDGNGIAVKDALQHMGPDIVFALRRMINYRDDSRKLKLIEWARKRGLMGFPIEDEWVRHYRAAAACRLADPETRTKLLGDWIRLLLETSEGSPQYDEASFCLSMVMGNLSPSACDPLIEAVTNSSTQLRRYAVGALVQFRSTQTERVTTALLDRLRKDPDGGVQFNAVQSLRRMPATIVPALVRELSNQSVPTRRGCLTALGSFTNQAPIILPAVLMRLDDPDSSVRDAATNTLRAISAIAPDRVGVN